MFGEIVNILKETILYPEELFHMETFHMIIFLSVFFLIYLKEKQKSAKADLLAEKWDVMRMNVSCRKKKFTVTVGSKKYHPDMDPKGFKRWRKVYRIKKGIYVGFSGIIIYYYFLLFKYFVSFIALILKLKQC